MYHYPPALLPPITDREDYNLTLAMVDDDTLQPIDLSGITLFNSGSSFTGNTWNVTDGPVATTSNTTITIPTFPVTGANNLTGLTLAVGEGLAINPGDPVQISDPTGKNSLIGFVISYAPDTGSLQVQIGWTFEFEIRHPGPRNAQQRYYLPWYDFGAGFDAPLLQANFQNTYLSLIDRNIVMINIPASIVRTIDARDLWSATGAPGTFLANMVGTDSVNTRQLLFGSLPILYGGVR
jgi:hypothetical protein